MWIDGKQSCNDELASHARGQVLYGESMTYQSTLESTSMSMSSHSQRCALTCNPTSEQHRPGKVTAGGQLPYLPSYLGEEVG